MKFYRAFATCLLAILVLSTQVVSAEPISPSHNTSGIGNAQREGILEDALLHQYSNQILNHIQSRNYCARVLNIKESLNPIAENTPSFETVVGVVSKNIKGQWEYLQMAIVDDIEGVRVTNVKRDTNLSEQHTKQLCAGKRSGAHYPLRGHFPARYVKEPVSEAEAIPLKYINLINQKRYDEALSLLSPHLRRSYMSPTGKEALTNVKHVDLVKLRDLSSMQPVHYYLPRHYAIKAYGAIIDQKVYDPKVFASCPGAIGLQVNTFVLIKYTPESPWLIDAQTGVPPSTAKLWGLDVGRYDWSFCGQEMR